MSKFTYRKWLDEDAGVYVYEWGRFVGKKWFLMRHRVAKLVAEQHRRVAAFGVRAAHAKFKEYLADYKRQEGLWDN